MIPSTAGVAPCGRLKSWAAIASAVLKGIRALATAHHELVATAGKYRCSIDLDTARQSEEPNAARWDYILATDDECIGMEVHPAKASEVDKVISKKRWAEERLAQHCDLKASRWQWVRPKGSRLQFTASSPQARRLAKSGVRFPEPRLL